MQVIEESQVTVVPANEAPWEDLQAVLGTADAPSTSGLIAYVDGEPAGWLRSNRAR